MAAPGIYGEKTYYQGKLLIEARASAKHGEWLKALKETGLTQPTAWRRMAWVKWVDASKDPKVVAMRRGFRKQASLLKRIQKDEALHGSPFDGTRHPCATGSTECRARKHHTTSKRGGSR